jgi:hypothetical protein
MHQLIHHHAYGNGVKMNDVSNNAAAAARD